MFYIFRNKTRFFPFSRQTYFLNPQAFTQPSFFVPEISASISLCNCLKFHHCNNNGTMLVQKCSLDWIPIWLILLYGLKPSRLLVTGLFAIITGNLIVIFLHLYSFSLLYCLVTQFPIIPGLSF
jgi:hypothetical protein